MNKKFLFFFVFVFLGLSNFTFSQSKLEKALNAFSAILTSISTNNYTAVDIISKTLTVNSTTKMGGHSRDDFKFTLPEGTKSYSVRVTVIPVKSSYQYEPDESFYNMIRNGKTKDVYAPQDKGINFFVFNHSYDADGFLSKKNFKYVWGFEKVNSFIYTVDGDKAQPGNYWVGLQNPDDFSGLNVIVEIVAFGLFNK